jgi:hypothetical protein
VANPPLSGPVEGSTLSGIRTESAEKLQMNTVAGAYPFAAAALSLL